MVINPNKSCEIVDEKNIRLDGNTAIEACVAWKLEFHLPLVHLL